LQDSGDDVREWVHKLEAPGNTAADNTFDEQALELKKLGNGLFREGPAKYAEALQKYTDAILLCESNPKLASVLRANRALLLLHLKKYSEALDDAKTALTNDPSYGKAYMRAGQACEYLKLKRRSLAWYKLALDKTKRNSRLQVLKLIEKVEGDIRLEEEEAEGAEEKNLSGVQAHGMGEVTRLGADGTKERKVLTREEMEEQKRRFDFIVKRHQLNSNEAREAIADYLTSLNGKMASAKAFVKRFPALNEKEAVDFLTWIQTGIQFKEEVIDKNKQKANDGAQGDGAQGDGTEAVNMP